MNLQAIKSILKNHRQAISMLILGITTGTLLSLGGIYGVQLTSDQDFCTVCHTMQPMADSWKESIHGGNNSSGWRAKCTDCHLPDNKNIPYYLYVKAKVGIHDVVAQLTYDLPNIDWEKKREERSHFTYDSGCLQCHKEIESTSQANMKSFLPHRDYFAGRIKDSCVDCHTDAGHKNLGNYLPKKKAPVPSKASNKERT